MPESITLSETEEKRSELEWIGSKVSYATMLKNVVAFDKMNLHFQHPKMLESIEINFDELCKNKECSVHWNKTNICNSDTSHRPLYLCEDIRSQIADKLVRIASIDRGITISSDNFSIVTEMASSLYLNDAKLNKLYQNDCKLNQNWFVNVYSYYLWLKVNIADYLVPSLQRFEQDLDSNENELGSRLLSYMFLLFSYYEDMTQFLLLFNCCLNSSIFLPVFYKLFEASFGSKQLKSASSKSTPSFVNIVFDILNHF